MKKILVILTGGTIGSVTDAGVISLNNCNTCTMIDMYSEFHKNEYGKPFDKNIFEIISPYNIFSENVNIDIYNRLIEAFSKVKLDDYSGVILTHGTDTMSYTSALMGLLYEDTDIPIMLVGSMIPPSDENSDAVYNFAAAVGYITDMAVANGRGVNNTGGVFTVDGGNEFGAVIHKAIELTEADTCTPVFGVYGDEEYGFYYFRKTNSTFLDADTSMEWIEKMYEDDSNKSFFQPNPSHVDTCISNVPNDILEKVRTNKQTIQNNVILLKQYPSLDYENININNKDAVLVYTYHSSTLCTEGEKTDFKKFVHRCKESGVRLYVASFDYDADKKYETLEMWEKDVIKLYSTSLEAAYMSVLILESK